MLATRLEVRRDYIFMAVLCYMKMAMLLKWLVAGSKR